jgi:pimeloyl-ACP methyl ester carboxylesterase
MPGSATRGCALDFAARKPELVETLVLLDAPLMDHDFSEEFMDYVREEERLVEAGDLDGARRAQSRLPVSRDRRPGAADGGDRGARLRLSGGKRKPLGRP